MTVLSRLPSLRFFALVVLLLITVGAAVQTADLAVGIWFTQIGVFLLPTLLIARAVNLSPSALLRLRFPLEGRLLGLIALASLANYFLAAGVMAAMEQLLPEGIPRVDAAAVLEMESGLRLVIIVAAVILAAPLCEEAAFRGFVQQGLMARSGPWKGIVTTGFLFALLHMDPVGLLSRFELGIFLGWLLWRTGSLWAPVLGHLVNNATALLLFFITGGEAAGAEAEVSLPVLVAGSLGMALLGLIVLLPLVTAIHRSTEGRESARPEAAVRPLDPLRPVGLSPVASVVTSGLLLLLTTLLLIAVLYGLSTRPPAPDLDEGAVHSNGEGLGDLALHYRPPSIDEEAPLSPLNLVPLPVLGVENPEPAFQIQEAHRPCNALHLRASFRLSAKASTKATTALIRSQPVPQSPGSR
ncbi:MAG: type II CAAX prenyl endopeptidase Rce1 family protein [Myxococcota bacterium]